jgi:hypothetical protein
MSDDLAFELLFDAIMKIVKQVLLADDHTAVYNIELGRDGAKVMFFDTALDPLSPAPQIFLTCHVSGVREAEVLFDYDWKVVINEARQDEVQKSVKVLKIVS